MAGLTRVSHVVLEESTGQEYRFTPEGPEVDEAEWRHCLEVLAVVDAPYVVASGSLAPGIPADFYAQVARLVKERGGRMVVDSSGPPLREALAEGVHLIKPSRGELESLLGRKAASVEEAGALALEVVESGRAEVVALTLGADGAILATRDGSVRLTSPKVETRSAVGAGDAFLGAMIHAMASGQPLRKGLRAGCRRGRRHRRCIRHGAGDAGADRGAFCRRSRRSCRGPHAPELSLTITCPSPLLTLQSEHESREGQLHCTSWHPRRWLARGGGRRGEGCGLADHALELAGEVLARDPLERPGELIVLLGMPLDRGNGYPQDAAALTGDGLELLRAAIDGRGADDLAGREPPQDALPDPGLDAVGERHHDLLNGLAWAGQNVAGLQVGPSAEPSQLDETATGQREERQVIELCLVGRELDRAALQPEPPDVPAVDRHEDGRPADRLP